LPIIDATPLLVAHHNGYFVANGLQADKPVRLRSWAQVIEAFLSGQVNVVHLLSPVTVWARYGAKVQAKVVAWNHINGAALTVLPDVDSVGDLGGKVVAVPFWYSIHNVLLQNLLRAHNLVPVLTAGSTLEPNEVRLVVMSPSDMLPALAARQIAGFIVAEPFNAAAENLKVGKVLRFSGDLWNDHACCVVFMHERDLNGRPQWTQKVVDAIVQAQLWTRTHPQQTAQLLSRSGEDRYTPHPANVLANVLVPSVENEGHNVTDRAIVHANRHNKRVDFQPYPYPSYTEELVRQLKVTQVDAHAAFLAQLDPAFVARDLVDDRFVRRSIAAAGGMKAFGLPDTFQRTETILAQ
jgi:NitT/TauT family transport system substrate-binding protein